MPVCSSAPLWLIHVKCLPWPLGMTLCPCFTTFDHTVLWAAVHFNGRMNKKTETHRGLRCVAAGSHWTTQQGFLINWTFSQNLWITDFPPNLRAHREEQEEEERTMKETMRPLLENQSPPAGGGAGGAVRHNRWHTRTHTDTHTQREEERERSKNLRGTACCCVSSTHIHSINLFNNVCVCVCVCVCVLQLKEENMSLRRTIRELQRRSETNERRLVNAKQPPTASTAPDLIITHHASVFPARVLELSEELLQRRRQEEQEAQDLESMVHSVEQNLHLMTVRFPEWPRGQAAVDGLTDAPSVSWSVAQLRSCDGGHQSVVPALLAVGLQFAGSILLNWELV